MICTRLFAVGVLVAVPMLGWSYDNAFTLTFEQASDADGITDATNGNTAVFAGENTAMDIPPFSVLPENAPGYNGTKWLRLGADVQAAGVGTYPYDGRAGGTTTNVSDFIATVDVYVNPTYAHRYQVALFGRWTGGNSIFEVFHSCKTPGQPDGFGWRSGGSTTTYNAFTTTTVTAPRWVRMKLQWQGGDAIVSIDENLDNVYEYISPVQTPVNQTAPGQIGLQLIINDPDNGHARIPDTYAYFDNLTYTPLASIHDWSVY